MRRGTVVSFDPHAGHGIVKAEDSEYFFHCTAIADGSRTIPVGAEVTFQVVPGHNGKWEATGLTP